MVLEPLLRFERLKTDLPHPPFHAIALTSATALSFCDLSDHFNAPIFTTGNATKQKAIEQGFTHVHSAEGGAKELATLIKNHYSDQSARILYPSALETAHDLGALLSDNRIECVNWPIYETKESESFSTTALNHLASKKIDLVLLYSQRTAQCFSRLWSKHKLSTPPPQLLAISQNVKESLPNDLAQNCLVSKEPNEASMRSCIKDITVED